MRLTWCRQHVTHAGHSTDSSRFIAHPHTLPVVSSLSPFIMSAAAVAAASYKPGDLSRLLAPSAGAPVIVSTTAAADPSFFGYLRPTKGRKPSRKSAKGGGKFSKETLVKKAKAKKAVANTQRDRHEKEVADAAARKLAAKVARLKAKSASSTAASAAADGDDGEEDSGLDDSDGDEGDEIDEAAIEDFMADIEAEEAGEGDASSDDEEVDEAQLDPLAKAKKERLAKRDKRLAEDKEAETPRPSKKDIKKQRVRPDYAHQRNIASEKQEARLFLSLRDDR